VLWAVRLSLGLSLKMTNRQLNSSLTQTRVIKGSFHPDFPLGKKTNTCFSFCLMLIMVSIYFQNTCSIAAEWKGLVTKRTAAQYEECNKFH